MESVALFAIFVGSVASLAGGWWLFLVVVPDYATSRFRYRLWQIRDEVSDDVITGRLPDVPVVKRLVHGIESVIRHAPEISFFLLILSIKHRAEFQEAMEASWKEDMRALNKPNQEAIRNYRRRLNETVLVHALLGCRSGWVFLAMLLLISVPYIYSEICRNTFSRIHEQLRQFVLKRADQKIKVAERVEVFAYMDTGITLSPVNCI